MDNRLLTVTKERILDELEASLQRHPRYKDVQVYHKFHTLKERQQCGVIMRGASAQRVNLAADDHMGELVSFCNLSPVQNFHGVSIEWAWEDQQNATHYRKGVDCTSLLLPDRQTVKFPEGTVLTAGFSNLTPAHNFAQVAAWIDGVRVTPGIVKGDQGIVVLTSRVPVDGQLLMSYNELNVDLPGYYFIEIAEDAKSFVVVPTHTVAKEVVLPATSGLETGASLKNQGVSLAAPYYLYTKKYATSNKIMLVPGQDYDLAADGTITFKAPLRKGTTLLAKYRWQGDLRGPFPISGEYTYNDTAIRGVVLAFGSRVIAGDRHFVQVNRHREPMASVSGGHYDMSFDIMVYTRDPLSLAELTDHLISDLWGNRKDDLISEGFTLKGVDPSGEAEESYDDAAGIMYFQHNISISMMTEWKKFSPYVVTIDKIQLELHRYPEVKTMGISFDGLPSIYKVGGKLPSFEVVYPTTGFPRL